VQPPLGDPAAGISAQAGGSISAIAAAAGMPSGSGNGARKRKERDHSPAPVEPAADICIPAQPPYLRLRLTQGMTPAALRQLGHEFSAHDWHQEVMRNQHLLGHGGVALVAEPHVSENERRAADAECRRHVGNTYLSAPAPSTSVGLPSSSEELSDEAAGMVVEADPTHAHVLPGGLMSELTKHCSCNMHSCSSSGHHFQPPISAWHTHGPGLCTAGARSVVCGETILVTCPDVQ
jgi:hypothetical protein